MSSQGGVPPTSPPQRHSTPLFMPASSSPVQQNVASSLGLTPRMARLGQPPPSSMAGASSPLFYGGTSSSIGRRTPGPRSSGLSRNDLARSVLSPNQVWTSTNLCRGSMSPRAHRRGDLGQQYSSNSITSPLQRREVFLVRENQSGQLTSESQVVAEDDDGQTRVIWGTNVSITESMKKFKEFLLGFQKKYRLRADNVAFDEGEGEEFTYVEMLKTVHLPVVVQVTNF